MVVAGEAEGLELLWDLAAERIHGLALWRTGSPDDAAEVVQEVFLKVLDTRIMPTNFRAWVYKIARNRCLDLIRARGRRREKRARRRVSTWW